MIDRTHTRNEVLLKIEGLNLTLGEGESQRLILRDVNAEVRNIIRPGHKQGQVVGFLGPSGIGKTQLFKRIAGFELPDSGSILIGQDQVPTRPGLVGVVEQHYVVFDHMTALHNLVFAGRQAGLTKEEAVEKAQAYLAQFDMMEHHDKFPKQLSGGQRQRLAILQQVMMGHHIICMDEPFSGLDVNQIQKVAELIWDLVSKNELLTIIVVTHDIGAAIEVSDTLWLMGHEPNPENRGEFLEGARILNDIDLVAEQLAWDPKIRLNPKYLEMERMITDRFRSLTRVS